LDPAKIALHELAVTIFESAVMNAFESSATVDPTGDIRVAGVPFAPGTEVEVTINPKRSSAEDFAAAWDRVCRELRASPNVQTITDEEIQQEIDDYRAGR
jgi:hypothetical protein